MAAMGSKLMRVPLSYFLGILTQGRFKRWLIGLALRFVPLPIQVFAWRGAKVVQCGCWRIETVEMWSKVVGPTGTVIVIEAEAANVARLRGECSRHELTNVEIVHKAIWRKQDTITLQVGETPGWNKIREAQTWSDKLPDVVYDETRAMTGDSLDRILDDIQVGPVDHIHMTISGGELDALHGMTEILGEGTTTIFIRSLLLSELDGKPTNGRVGELLRAKGYQSVLTPSEPGKYGGNVFAWKPRAG
jgi:FkbM family methyltransferase